MTSSNSSPGSSHSTVNSNSSPKSGSRTRKVATPRSNSRRYARISVMKTPLTCTNSQPARTPAAAAGESGLTCEILAV